MSETNSDNGGAEARPASYEAAVERLEAIVAELDSGQVELRKTVALTREAKTLIEFCFGELEAASGELRELGLDELVTRLENPGAPETEQPGA
jgi:exodeoxyribonuclease VII small subunit